MSGYGNPSDIYYHAARAERAETMAAERIGRIKLLRDIAQELYELHRDRHRLRNTEGWEERERQIQVVVARYEQEIGEHGSQ